MSVLQSTLTQMQGQLQGQQQQRLPYPSVGRNDDDYASKTLANIKRQQWNDYMARYPAIHQQYLSMAMNPDFTLEQVDRVRGNVDQGFSRAKQSQQATLARMGVADNTRDDGIDKALAITHGENSIREHGKTRGTNALGGGNFPSLQTQGG